MTAHDDTSIQILSAKSTRRIARAVGDATITRAWVDNAHAHHVVQFVTWDHLHGWYVKPTGQWGYHGIDAQHRDWCYTERGELRLDLEPWEDDGRWPIHGIDR